ncbi:hypothetical protein [Acinetobacter indicus]|uniref:Large polyvalent protein-associated domain-containing protein n=1 Tax=Acinetobacter indicus TaxID=756892 RepID=A0A6C0Y6E1_9GAMM|nr:hypothetical protein [Acinetobacter indicus]QIC71693.1 hypothetical protein FSC09_14960 [Acinetobacter indicus]
MAVKKWIDLTQFGVRAVVSSATQQREKVGLLVVQDPALFTQKTNISIGDFLKNAQSKGATIVESEFPDSDMTLMLDPKQNSFSTKLLKQLIPGIEAQHLRDMDTSEIYINHDANIAEGRVAHWTNIVSQGKDAPKVGYVDSKAAPLSSSLVQAFQEHDHEKKAEMFFEHYEADAFPLAQLEKYGYTSDKSLVAYYPTEEIAIAAGVDLMNLKPVQLPNTSLPIKSNSQGQILAFSDISQIPEMLNYDVSAHKGWSSLYQLPNAVTLNHNALVYFDNQFRALNKYSQNLNEENVGVMLSGIAETNSYVNKVLYERYPDLKQQFSMNSRFDVVKKDGQFKVQHAISDADGKWSVTAEENVNRTNFSAALNDMYVRLSEIHAPINALRGNLRRDFKNVANNLTVAYSNLETELEAQLAYQSSLVAEPSDNLEDGLDPKQATATVEDIEDTASAVLSGEITVEPGKPLHEAIKVVEPEVIDVAPNDIAPEVLIDGVEPTPLLRDLHQLDQHIRLQAIPNILNRIKQGEKDRDLLVNARQKSVVSNMIVGMGGVPSQINSLAPYAAHMLHPTTDLVFAQGRLHAVEQQNSTNLSYLAYLNDLREHIHDYKSDFVKPEYVDNLLLHKAMTEHEIEAGFEDAKNEIKANFTNETFGFGNIVHENADLVQFVQNVEARTITRQNIASEPLAPISFETLPHSGITVVKLPDFDNAQPQENINTAVADFVIQERLREYAKLLLQNGAELYAELENSSPNNILADTRIFDNLTKIARDAHMIERASGQSIIPMLSSNKAVQDWLKLQSKEQYGITNPMLGVGDHIQFKAQAAADILSHIVPGVIAYDQSLKNPTLDVTQVKTSYVEAQAACVNFNESYYRLGASATHQQGKALHYVQNFIPSLNHDDYPADRKHVWVMNRANSDKPFQINSIELGDIKPDTQEELSVRNLRDAAALGFAAYSRNKLYTDLGFSGDVATNMENLIAVHKKQLEAEDEEALIEAAERLFKSINDKTANYYKNGVPSLDDFTVDSANLKLSLISDPSVTTQFDNALDYQTALTAIQAADVLFHKNVSIEPYDNSTGKVPDYIANTLNSDKQFSQVFEYMQPTIRERRYEVQPNPQSLSDVTHDFIGTAVNQFKNNLGMFESSEFSYQQNLDVVTRTNANLSYMRILPADLNDIAKQLAYRDGPGANRNSDTDLAWEKINSARLGTVDNLHEMSFDALNKEITAKVVELDVARPSRRFEEDDQDDYLDKREYEDYLERTGQEIPPEPYRPVDAAIPLSMTAKIDLHDLPYPTAGMLKRLDNTDLEIRSSEVFKGLDDAYGNIALASMRENVFAMPPQMILDAINLSDQKEAKKQNPDHPNNHQFNRADLFVYEIPPKGKEHGAYVLLPEFVKPPEDAKLKGNYQVKYLEEKNALKAQLENEIATKGKEVAPLRAALSDQAAYNTGIYYSLGTDIVSPIADNSKALMTIVDVQHELSAHTVRFGQANIASVDDLHKFLMQDVQNQMEALGSPDDYNVVRLTGNEELVGRFLVVPPDLPVEYTNRIDTAFSFGHVYSKKEFKDQVVESNRRTSDSAYFAGPRAVSQVLNNANNLANIQGTTLPVARTHRIGPYQQVIASRLIKEGYEATKAALLPSMADHNRKPPESVLNPHNAVMAYQPATETKHASIAVLPSVHEFNKQKLSDGFVLLSVPTALPDAPHNIRNVIEGLDTSILNDKNATLNMIASDCEAGADLEEQKHAVEVIEATNNQEHISPPVPPKEPKEPVVKPQPQPEPVVEPNEPKEPVVEPTEPKEPKEPKVEPPKIPQPTSEQQESATPIAPAPRKSSTPKTPSGDQIEDTGYKIPGAKKDLYNVTLTVSQIEAMTLKQMEGILKLNKMWKKTSVEYAQEKGIDVRAYLITDCLRKIMPSQPDFPTAVNTSPEQITRVGVVYNQVVTDIRNAVIDKTNLTDIRKALSDVYSSWEANPKFHEEVQRNFKAPYRQIQQFWKEQQSFDVVLKARDRLADQDPARLKDVDTLAQNFSKITDLSYEMGKAYSQVFRHSSFRDRLPKGVHYYSLLENKQLKASLNDDQLNMVYKALNPKTETEETLRKKEWQERRRNAREELNEIMNSINNEMKEMSSKKSLMPTVDDPKLMVNDFSDRNGRNVTAEELQHRFGFKACEFGNYLNQKDRQEALNLAYDGCAALAKMIDIPDRMVGFDGLMALANGSRGSQSALAHYESDFRVINLTKKKGYGSFAHEWFHALDNAMMDIEVQKNPKLERFMRNRFLSEELGSTRSEAVSDAAKVMGVMIENIRRPNYEKVDLDGVIRNLREKEEHYKMRVIAMAHKAGAHSPEYGKAAADEIVKVFKAREANRKNYFYDSLTEHVMDQNLNDKSKRNIKMEEYREKAVGWIFGNKDTAYNYELPEYRKTMAEEYEAAGMDEKTLKARFNAFSQTARSHIAKVVIPDLVEDVDALAATRFLLEKMRDQFPEKTIQAENGKGHALDVFNYMAHRHTVLNTTVFHRDALYLDAMQGRSTNYWSTILEEFARCGEAVTIEGQKEKNMGNNDWLVRRDRGDNNALGFEQERIMGNARPMGTEREQIVTSYKDFINVAMDHIKENLPEMRLRDHLLYIKHELSELQSLDVRNVEREEELRGKLDVIEKMTPQEFDAHYKKEYENFLKQDPQRLAMAERLEKVSAAKKKPEEEQLGMAL